MAKLGGRVRWRQNIGYLCGLTIGVGFIIFLCVPRQDPLHALGPMNVGHEELSCGACHTPAPGTLRQQLQANARYALALRSTPADFGHQDVTNDTCLKCHDRPNDRHSVFRFIEPRFKEARAMLKPHECVSCHLEHSGVRVTQDGAYCVTCHQKTKLKHDPINIPHAELIAAERWETCLQCHDFHGNHVMKPALELDKASSVEQVLSYFDDGPSPYSDKRYFKAKTEEALREQ